MSNKRALWSFEQLKEKIKLCNEIISKTQNWKTKRDFEKHKKKLQLELKEYCKWRGIKYDG